MVSVWSKPWVAKPSKDAQLGIVWRGEIEKFKRRRVGESGSWETVYQVSCCSECIAPIGNGYGGVREKSQACFNKMAMASLCKAIMLGSVGWRCKMGDAVCGKKIFHSIVFSPVI